jgi:hypothetical protein
MDVGSKTAASRDLKTASITFAARIEAILSATRQVELWKKLHFGAGAIERARRGAALCH